MPCYSPEPLSIINDLNADNKRLKRELDKVTRLLCKLTKEAKDASLTLDNELSEWYTEHEAFDRRRKDK